MRTVILAVALLASLGVNGYLYLLLSQHREQKPYSFRDETLIERSVADYAARSHLTREEAMRARFPVVARTSDGACVNLRLRRGYLGWVPVYCYSADGRLTYRGKV